MAKTIIIGSRGSTLALAQAEIVISKLQALYPRHKFKLKIIKTKGDRIKSAALLRKASKGLFVKELEQALLKKKIDLAVHSLKDLPSQLPEGLKIGAILEREDPRDVLISKGNIPLDKLPAGAKIGTASLRRQAQILAKFKELKVIDIRGNIDTRIRKATAPKSRLAGIVLAMAGIKRIYKEGLNGFIPQPISPDVILPAPAQGALGLEIRANDDKTAELIASLNHETTALTIRAERRLLEKLEGGCQVPLGGYAELQDGELLRLTAVLCSPDGSKVLREEMTGSTESPEEIADALAMKLRNKGATEILQSLGRNK
ncbi:hydroxymethylbilane synthase [Candidatus Peregrinibacteria bacterium]|nr:hydroxymethylbilane synthase [Candidatus Peregrinibacteria bacterium]